MNSRKGMLLSLTILCLLSAWSLSPAWGNVIGNATYGIYSDTYEGIVYDSNTVEGGYMGAWGGAILSSDTTKFVEGGRSLKVFKPSASAGAGVWIQFGYDGGSNPKIQTDMSAYSGGSIDFDVCTTNDFLVKLEWGASGNAGLNVSAVGGSLDGNWHHVSIPLSSFNGIDLSHMVIPAGFHISGAGADKTFWVDNVVWRKSSTGTFSLSLKNVSDGQSASSISWTGVNAGNTHWKSADQYLELKYTYFQPGWGMQIYTDNKASDANPRFSGTDDPSGLINTSSPTFKIPVCWRIVDVTTSTHIMQGAMGYDNNHVWTWLPDRLWEQQLNDQYPCYLWMKDRNTQTIPGTRTTAFSDGEDYITFWNELRGIEHAEFTFSGAPSPNYIYFGADFSDAIAPVTYKTGKLTVELYYE
jgi:hypothetical protein